MSDFLCDPERGRRQYFARITGPTKIVSIRIPGKLKKDLDRWAALNGMSLSHLVLFYLNQVVEKNQEAIDESHERHRQWEAEFRQKYGDRRLG